jgi:hypothetical protein
LAGLIGAFSARTVPTRADAGDWADAGHQAPVARGIIKPSVAAKIEKRIAFTPGSASPGVAVAAPRALVSGILGHGRSKTVISKKVNPKLSSIPDRTAGCLIHFGMSIGPARESSRKDVFRLIRSVGHRRADAIGVALAAASGALPAVLCDAQHRVCDITHFRWP